MFGRWSRVASQLSKVGSSLSGRDLVAGGRKDLIFVSSQNGYSRVSSAAEAPAPPDDPVEKGSPGKSVVNLDRMFWSKPSSLALAPDSRLRIEEPQYGSVRRFMLKLMLYYSKQSKAIRGANVVYSRILSQVDRPAIYEVFNLEKTFKMTFALLVLHTWLCLRRLKQEGKEGAEFGQYVYEIYNHDVELRVSKAGVNLLLTKWMKDLEKIFYGNVVAYDAALLPEAKPDELQKVIWRNIYSDDGTSQPDAAALKAVQAMTRYVHREVTCLSLTDKETMYSGNFMFTSLDNSLSGSTKR